METSKGAYPVKFTGYAPLEVYRTCRVVSEKVMKRQKNKTKQKTEER